MKILKNILAVLGLLVVILIGLAVFTGYSSEAFKQENAPFVESYVRDFSQNWSLSDVEGRSTNEFLTQIATPQGKAAIRAFRTFGRLEAISDLEMPRYFSGTNGTSAVFQFKGRFSNGSAVVEIEVMQHGGKVRVQRIRLTPIGAGPPKQTEYKT
jgi:hypothetical protein